MNRKIISSIFLLASVSAGITGFASLHTRAVSPRDSLFVRETISDERHVRELIRESDNRILYTMWVEDGSSLDYLFRYGEGDSAYDCIEAYNNAADGSSFLFYRRSDRRLYITSGCYGWFEPIPESVDFLTRTVLLKNRFPELATSDTLDLGRSRVYTQSRAAVIRVRLRDATVQSEIIIE